MNICTTADASAIPAARACHSRSVCGSRQRRALMASDSALPRLAFSSATMRPNKSLEDNGGLAGLSTVSGVSVVMGVSRRCSLRCSVESAAASSAWACNRHRSPCPHPIFVHSTILSHEHFPRAILPHRRLEHQSRFLLFLAGKATRFRPVPEVARRRLSTPNLALETMNSSLTFLDRHD